MSEMVERIAKAMWLVSAEPEHGDTWEGLSEGWRENHRAHTRAMLAAMREPDITQVEDACSQLRGRGDTPDAIITNDRHWFEVTWKAGIDAALAENGQ